MAKDKETKVKEAKPKHEDKPAKASKSEAAVETKAKSAGSKKASASGGEGKKGPRVPLRPLLGGTYAAKTGEHTPKWRLVDAAGVRLGRLSSQIATMLMGKDKAYYTRSSDTGDNVIVINAEKVLLTGKKWQDKLYKYHTNYPGGLKVFTAKDILNSPRPNRLIEWSVYGMLPKGHMGRKWYKKLWVYKGAEHPHAAQKPETVKLPDLGATERN